MEAILAMVAVLGFFMILAMCSALRKPNDCIKYIARDVDIPDDTPEKRIARAAAAMRFAESKQDEWWSL